MRLARSKRSLMSRTMTGEAKRLSVGISKKPWIWPACRSSVMTRSAPAAGDQVGDQLGRNRRARADLAVLPGVAEIRNNRGDAARRRRASARPMMISSSIRWSLAGNEVDWMMNASEPRTFSSTSTKISLSAETADAGLGQRLAQPLGDFLRQHRIGIAGDQLDGAVLGRHRGFPPRLAGYDVQHLGIPTRTGASTSEVISRRGSGWQPGELRFPA